MATHKGPPLRGTTPSLLIYDSKARLLLPLAVSAGLVVLGGYLTTRPETMLKVAGGALVILFGLAVVALINRFIRGGPAVVIDDEGIKPRRGKIRLIPWSDVTAIERLTFRSVDVLHVRVTHPGDYSHGAPAVLAVFAKQHYGINLSPVILGFQNMSHSTDDVWAFLTTHHPALCREVDLDAPIPAEDA